jgi:hypothetical protein
MNTIGQVAGVASTEYALSSMIWAGVREWSDGSVARSLRFGGLGLTPRPHVTGMAKNGDFEVSAGQQYGLYAGLLIVHGIFNSLRTSQLAAMTRGFVFVIVGVTLIIPLLLLFLTPLSQMNSPEWVFTEVNNRASLGPVDSFALPQPADIHNRMDQRPTTLTVCPSSSVCFRLCGARRTMVRCARHFACRAQC